MHLGCKDIAAQFCDVGRFALQGEVDGRIEFLYGSGNAELGRVTYPSYCGGPLPTIGLSPGYFAFYAGTMPEQADVVERELLAEAELLRNDGLTAEELQRAKAKVIGQKKIARQDLGTLAMSTALDELYGLGYAHTDTEDALFEAVTLQQVKQVAQKYLRPENVVVSHAAPPLLSR